MQLTGQIIGAAFMCVLLGGFGIVAARGLAHDDNVGAAISWLAFTFLPCPVIAWRFIGIRIIADDSGVILRGFWRSRHLHWDQIKRIRWAPLRGSWPSPARYYGPTFETDHGSFRSWALTRLEWDPPFSWQKPARGVWKELDRRAGEHGVDSVLTTSMPT
jgi:hypothetical protein